MLFRWGEHKISMSPVLHFERDIEGKVNYLIVAVNKHQIKRSSSTRKVIMCDKQKPTKHGPFKVTNTGGY